MYRRPVSGRGSFGTKLASCKIWTLYNSPLVFHVVALLAAVVVMTLAIGGVFTSLHPNAIFQTMMSSSFQAWHTRLPQRNVSHVTGPWRSPHGGWEFGYHLNREWWG